MGRILASIGDERVIAFTGRGFVGEGVTLAVAGVPSGAAVANIQAALVDPQRNVLAGCADFAAGAEPGELEGTLELGTEELCLFMAAIPSGSARRVAMVIHDTATDEVFGGGFLEVVAAPAPSQFTPIPPGVHYVSEAEMATAIGAAVAGLAAVARSGDYADLLNKPAIPAAQVNADWTAESGVAAILHKPASMTPTAHASTHAVGGSDAITPAAIGAATDTAVVHKTGDTMTGGLTVPNLTVGSRASGSTIGQNSVAEGYDTTASGECSHAEGFGTTASNYYSHAEGNSGTASGEASHAEGSHVTASGDYSHAEGYSAAASGMTSHAEGENTTASGMISHAEGAYATASGDYSHAEGSGTTASGGNSHAEGETTIAGGDFSHAEGESTTAQNEAEHAQGRYNASHTGNTDAEKTIHSIGVGTYGASQNAVEVMRDGKVFIKGIGGYDGTNPTGTQNPAADLAATVSGLLPAAQRNLLAYASSTTLSPGTAVYRTTATLSGTAAAIPTPDATAIPQANAYFCFELEVAVDATATSIAGPSGWEWLDGGELPTSGFAGATLYIACRLDCTTRAVFANVWRVEEAAQ